MTFPEYDIYQNRVMGAHLIWEFTKAYCDHNVVGNNSGPTIYHALPILPLCLNQRVVEGIHSRNFKEGSLSRAIQENRDIFSGLQERMIDMSGLTFSSIDIAFKANLLVFEHETMTFIPNSLNISEKYAKQLFEDYSDMLRASRRIGSWFSQLSFGEISMNFNIII